MTTASASRQVAALSSGLRDEVRAVAIYRWLAGRTADAAKKDILIHLAEAEERHAERYRARLAELGETVELTPADSAIPLALQLRARMGIDNVLRAIEAEENKHVADFSKDAAEVGDATTQALLEDIAEEERQHAKTLHTLAAGGETQGQLQGILRRERHVSTGSWIGDAIYGANDGLGAVFGLVAGVAGANFDARSILITGVAGAVSSAVSMGSGAFLAAKSEREVYDAEIARERQELLENPEEEIEELSLFYQLKGFSAADAEMMARKMAEEPERMLQTLASEELGLTEGTGRNPWVAATSATISTALGSAVPVLPFAFMGGSDAIIVGFLISMVGHFAVGAAKSLVTVRSWWSSGFEMTWIGLIVSVVSYAVGTFFGAH